MNQPSILHESPLDTQRFGIRVVRGTLPPQLDVKALSEALDHAHADLAIVRTNAGDSSAMVQLARRGKGVIHAGTLVYYTTDLPPYASRPCDPCVRPATQVDLKQITDIATLSFGGYRSHYAANPLLPTAGIAAGYVEWAASRLSGDASGGCTWVITDGDRVAGFAACDASPAAHMIDIILNAVHPAHSRKGLYGRLLRTILAYYAQHGFLRLQVSTQIWNYVVQRQWARAGLVLDRAYDTYHIDRRLEPATATAGLDP